MSLLIFETLHVIVNSGFASTGDDSLPGNFGLMDQIAALKWVQRNIAAFGGNPKSVTLAGQGSGASAASILALSPEAEGLFHRIILLSGTAISPGVVRETAINATWALEGHLSCRASNSTQLLHCLRDNRPSSRLLDPNRPHVFYDDYYEYAPIVDKSRGIIPESIERLAQSRPKIPMMIGTTRDESAWHLMKVGRENLNMTSGLTKTQAEEAVRNLTSQFSAFTNHKLITEGCLYRYIYSLSDPATDWTVLRDGLLDLYSHFWFHAPASRLATLYDDSRVPVYLYSFDFTIRKSMLEREQWAFHGTDLIFLFDLETEFVSHYPDKEWQNDQRVTEIFSQLLTNFVKYNISHTPSMKVGFHWDGHSFWNDYARKLDSVDIGNLGYIAALKEELYQYKLATFVLLGCATLFLAILVGLGCYCTRKDPEEEDL
uniref:Carboxylesterase type B domain-containing protein n=1 Tax=Romanomermis culicivorax TaxID=13658 RepID=A0A915IPR4_ROMCU